MATWGYGSYAALGLGGEWAFGRVLGSLLAHRGIRAWSSFVHAPLASAASFRQTLGAQTALNRLTHAITAGEKVLVYGDYDVDGVTAVALVLSYLRACGLSPLHYFPHRLQEGYGFSSKGLAYAQAQGCQLIVLLDCGTSDTEMVLATQQSGIDVLICDHHRADEQVPPALAVLNPHQAHCSYPHKDLSACALAYAWLRLHAKERGFSLPEEAIGLVALSLVADQVPLLGEARALLSAGLAYLAAKPPLWWRALTVGIWGAESPTGDMLGFQIAPLLNAAGRMAHADKALAVFRAPTMHEAQTAAETLRQLNAERKATTAAIDQEVKALIAPLPQAQHAIVLCQKAWHLGVLGISASRCVDTYGRPTVLLAQQGEYAIGSGRTAHAIDLYAALKQCEQWLTRFGGHAAAVGLTLPIQNLNQFQQTFTQAIQHQAPEWPEPKPLQIDFVLPFGRIDDTLRRAIQCLEPCGSGNPRPTFASTQVRCTAPPQLIGGEHLRLRLAQADTPPIEAIAFGWAHLQKPIQCAHQFHIAYQIEWRTNAHSPPQLLIQDMLMD